ncbi:MAG: glycerol-3-phosphate 1-O-acyltransferase PlsY [Bacteroidetes bacterium]|nr:glycerol-3-phosphate 1-O-acyltransferase PlsY [Bacteroidota bacterium]
MTFQFSPDIILPALLILSAYFIGAIPSAVWIGKLFFNTDVRLNGSCNPGATNAFRVLGIKGGIPVLVMDVLKGYGVVQLAYLQDLYRIGDADFDNFRLTLGMIAVVGHIFSVYIGFKGGKGVAALLGVFFALLPWPALLSLGMFVIILLTTRYVSLGSMCAGIGFPFFTFFLFPPESIYLEGASVLVALLLIFTHRKNIVRLIKQEESKANLFLKRRNQ